jgi:hypothetical protein
MAESVVEVALPMPAPGSTLSANEICAFVNAVKALPEGRVPTFTPTEIAHLPDLPDLADAAGRYQLALRAALDPHVQALAWENDPTLRAAFQKIHVSPEVFAAVTLRISCAWSARTMARDASPAQIRRQLNQRIRACIAGLKRSYLEMSPWDRKQALGSLEEMIALGEFLWLWEQVPAKSLELVGRFHEELETVLPSTPLANASPIRRFSSPIQQAGYESPER